MRRSNSLWLCLAACLIMIPVLGRLRGSGVVVPTHTVLLSVHEELDRADESVVKDDQPISKEPSFLETLVDSRPLDGWQVNSSAAVLCLDSPGVDARTLPSQILLYPTYAAALGATLPGDASTKGGGIIPSIDLVDAKAKQVDDGLYAALDAAWFSGDGTHAATPVDLVQRIYKELPKQSPAAPFLAASLELAGCKVAVADEPARDRWLADFRNDPGISRPIGFYTWTETLQNDFRFSRFLQTPLHPDVAQDIARVLDANPALLKRYRESVAFFAGLTNPPACRCVADLCSNEAAKGRPRATASSSDEQVAFFPHSRSKESRLFERLYGLGVPPNANLMRDLIGHIRSGEVDLAPSAQSGWYDYQVYALESLLLPERAGESPKLVMTRDYKLRLLKAFKTMSTTRRETHVKMLPPGSPGCPAPTPSLIVRPRLRVEPNPTYYLRVARSYAFLAGFLNSTVGPATLSTLHGLKQDGQRDVALATELRAMRDLFYGLYFVSAEDIGLRPQLLPGEPADEQTCREAALQWLATAAQDADLAADARVSIPIMAEDEGRTRYRLWLVMGVRLAPFHAAYAPGCGPRLRPLESAGPWQSADPGSLQAQDGLIPVSEFAEVTVGPTPPTREELRSICDSCQTTDELLAALRKFQPQPKGSPLPQ